MHGAYKWSAVLCLTGFGVSYAAASAAATTQYSSTFSLGVHAGHNYYNQATITDTNRSGVEDTYVTGGSVGVGLIGSEAILYYQTGDAFCTTSGMSYNKYSNTTSYYATVVKPSTCSGGKYYFSKGKSGCWNGNGYDYFYSYRTPASYFS